MKKALYICIVSSLFFNIGSLFSCKTSSSRIVSLNENKAIQYGTEKFYDWESTKKNKLEDAYDIFRMHLLENPDTKTSEYFDRGILGGYFGVMVPVISVKWCHFERSYNYS